MKNRGLFVAAFLGVLLLALAVRFYDLGTESIWLDEMFSLNLSRLPIHGIVDECSKDVHPPLYFMLLKSWTQLFGHTENALRSLSVVFGLFSVILLFLIGRRVFGPDTGLLAALILALSVFNVHYSQEVRAYSLMAFLALASYYLFLTNIDRPHPFRMSVYCITVALLLYTHFLGVLVPLSQAGFLLVRPLEKGETNRIKRIFPFMAVLLIAGLLFLPWLNILKQQVSQVAVEFWIPRPNVLRIGVTFLEFSGSFLLLPLFGFLAGRALYKRVLGREETLLIFCWLGIPLAAAFLISLVAVSVNANKVFIGSAPAFYLLVARGLTSIPSTGRRYVLLIMVVLGSGIALEDYYRQTNKTPWREAAAFLKDKITDNDVLVFYSGYTREVLEHYLGSHPAHVVQFRFDGAPLRKEEVETTLSSLPSDKAIWLVLAHPGPFEGLVRNRLGQRRHRTMDKAFMVRKYHLPQDFAAIELLRYE
ncbi:MAG: glycosyltransferase family 39 protein [Fibrobacterota bacterium]